MGLSKKHLSKNTEPVVFLPDRLAEGIQKNMAMVTFAYLLGSAAEKYTVEPGSDLDLALYLSGKPTLELYRLVDEVCLEYVGNNIRCDTGILNNAEPVYRFEALKGRLLFTRDIETWLKFYSRTCREYESQMFHYSKQHQYRLEASS